MYYHFTYRIADTNLRFYNNLGTMINSDGDNYNPSSDNKNWTTVFGLLKVEAVIENLSNIEICISAYLDRNVPEDIPIENTLLKMGGFMYE